MTPEERKQYLRKGEMSKIARRLRPPVRPQVVSMVVNDAKTSRRIQSAVARVIAPRAGVPADQVFPRCTERAEWLAERSAA